MQRIIEKSKKLSDMQKYEVLMVNGNANNDFSNQKDVALQVSGPNNAFGNLIKSSFKTKSKS